MALISGDASLPTTIKEFEVSDRIKQIGFTRIYIIGKTLVLHYTSGATIQSQYYKNDLTKTIRYLKNAIAANHDLGGIAADRLIVYLTELILKSAEAEYQQFKKALNNERSDKESIIEEINQTRNDNARITPDEWCSQLVDKYQALKNIVHQNMPEIWPGLEFELSILRILNIEDCTLPFIGILLGRPSSGKTVIVDLLRKWYCAFYTDNFTARSFVSHSTTVSSREELEEIDLLPKIKNKLFLTPELSPTFTSKDEDLIQLLGIITRIADGHGFVSDSGAHGHRGYDENIMFVWVGAAVDVPYKVYKVLSNLGAKLYFFRMKFEDRNEEELLRQATTDKSFSDKLNEIRGALFDYLKWFDIGPNLTLSEDIQIPKIEWNKTKDDINAIRLIIKLATLLSHLRCMAQTWETHDTQGLDYAYTVSNPEDPSRAITVLYNLACGHALLTGRNFVTIEDIPIIVKTVMSTAQIERVSLFSLLLANNGKLTTRNILESLNISKPTALRTMAELKAIGLVNVNDIKEEDNPYGQKEIVLKQEFSWFLSDEFKKLMEDYAFVNNVCDDHRKEKLPPTTPNISTPDYVNSSSKKEDIFWRIYINLEREEQQNPSNQIQVDKNTISHSNLHQALVSSGHFYQGDATQIISDMVKAGKLEEAMYETYRREISENGAENSNRVNVIAAT